ncbi:alpha/beta hydrolase fold-domain-containing protein [Coniella lustricola]|uniref:Alpha/beta hydrolase fold-domain-containing protein n=1 Tax=Coniella lustricola TaxID=2025994 RepID=A0A2T2ZWD3_9PEZI|nr:alpha/beta hydrolase fold-domain-containing protein [Coniella lustricola]
MKIALEKEAAAYPPPAESVVETVVEVKSFDGATITVSRFSLEQHRVPLAKGQPLRPAVYHVHGGGMITGSVDLWRPLYVRNVAMWDVQVFAVDYRVAPENQAPGPVEDSFAGLKWLSENALSLGVDPARLVIYGDSAGGGIAAGTTILARDRGLEPPLAKQILVYPMIDDRTKYGSDWPVREFLAWTEKDNLIGWTAYLGADRAGREDADVSIYEAPGRATPEDLVGLPRTYIDTAGFDLFRDDNLQYAARLLQAGVEVEFHLYPGVPHGFEKATSASVVKRAMENRRLAIATV